MTLPSCVQPLGTVERVMLTSGTVSFSSWRVILVLEIIHASMSKFALHVFFFVFFLWYNLQN